MADHPLLNQLQRVCAQADAEFARAAAVHGSRIRCGRGCSDCCSQVFQITEVEAARIHEHVQTLPAAEREALQAKAREYISARAELFDHAEQWGSPMPQGAGLPCPALGGEGECTIYAARPIICRKFGVPIFNPDNPGRVSACELNFKAGDAIEDAGLVANQTALYRAQQQLQSAWNEQGGGRDDAPISIARAIIEDFRPLLP